MSPDIFGASTLEAMMRAGAAALPDSSSPRLDARVLAKTVLGCDDAGLISRAPEVVGDDVKRKYDALIMRRAGGEPVAYITGVKEFWGQSFKVTRDVLIPRSDSECLIEAVLARRPEKGKLRILDLGSGSGCLLCALLTEFPQATGVGVDVSGGAIKVARENALLLGLSARAEFIKSDWFENVEGAFDVVIANAPYIPDGDKAGLIVDVSDYEPSGALFAGADGLDAYRHILGEIAGHLAPGAHLILEYGQAEQGAALRAMIANSLPNGEISVVRDLAARERGVIITLK